MHFKQPFGMFHLIVWNNANIGRREMCAPELLNEFIPSWKFLPSPRNITIESGWRPLFYTWGVNILEFYEAGLFDGFFEAGNPLHE